MVIPVHFFNVKHMSILTNLFRLSVAQIRVNCVSDLKMTRILLIIGFNENGLLCQWFHGLVSLNFDMNLLAAPVFSLHF